ncbi:hypothetical protein DCO57_04700 [Labrenzia sp. 011]|nr:hypothetical protein DCO57_04700 [Labrenzia sp. 011]
MLRPGGHAEAPRKVSIKVVGSDNRFDEHRRSIMRAKWLPPSMSSHNRIEAIRANCHAILLEENEAVHLEGFRKDIERSPKAAFACSCNRQGKGVLSSRQAQLRDGYGYGEVFFGMLKESVHQTGFSRIDFGHLKSRARLLTADSQRKTGG